MKNQEVKIEIAKLGKTLTSIAKEKDININTFLQVTNGLKTSAPVLKKLEKDYPDLVQAIKIVRERKKANGQRNKNGS